MTRRPHVGDQTVSVVVCAFTEERWDDLAAAMAALRDQARRPDQVVLVVDNNDALWRRAHDAWAPDVEVVRSREAPGLSGARNSGVAAATGTLVAFLDDDATPARDWLERLVAPFADDRVLAVGGSALPRWPGARPRWWPQEFDWVVGCSYRGLPAEGGEVRNVLGATMAFRADVFADGERFSSAVGRVGAVPSGCEETELCIRIRQRRPEARIVFEPRARVLHRVTPARRRLSYFVRRCFAEGRSKATMTGLVGSRDGLSSERGYVLRTLTSGVARGLGSAVRQRDPAGLARAGTIGLALSVTTAGYVLGPVEGRRHDSARDAAADFRPVHLVQVDLAEPAAVPAALEPASGLPYRRARVLVRDHGRPVGTVDVDLVDGGLGVEAVTALRDRVVGRAPAGPPAADAEPDDAPATAMPGGLTASVVVATRDRPRELRRCLDSVLATGYPGLEVVVVDNAPSSPATEEMLRRDYPTVRYVREDVPGLARAHNRGLAHVHGAVVAFTDDDVVVDPGWLHALVACLAADDRVGCVTGLIWPAELETAAQAMIESHGAFGKGFQRRTFNLNGSRPEDPLFPYTAGSLGSGANMAFRTEVLRDLGGFDPRLGAGSRGRGGDDLAAFYDVVTAGHSLVYEPAAVVHHRHRREYAAVRTQARNYGTGLSAYLTRVAVHRPVVLADFARLAPRGLAHLLAGPPATDPRGAGATALDGPARPRELLLLQLLGAAQGPWAFARSARHARRTASDGAR